MSKDIEIINKYVCSILNLPIPDNRGKRYYTQLPRFLDQRKVHKLPHIIFITYYPDSHLLKKAMTLRDSGKVFTTLLAGCIREDIKIEDYFDQYYEYGNFREFHELVGRAKPHSWHVVSPLYHPAIVINSCGNNSRLVIDINDAALFLTTDKNDLSVQIERAVMTHADYIVHKLPEEGWNILAKEYELKCENSSIMSYPHSKFICMANSRRAEKPPLVVYAGGIIPYEIAVARGHENHVFDDLIALTGQESFDLSIYVNQNAREMPWHQHKHYFDLEDKYRYFHLKKGIPYHSVTKHLSRYEAGIFFDNISISSYDLDHFKYNVASKFFTYLEAGLPIVVFEEAETMADLIRRYELGTIYTAWEPKTIIDAIREISKKDYTENIKSFCNEFRMENVTPLLLGAHKV